MKPLDELPKIRSAPLTENLPFGPSGAALGYVGSGPLTFGGEEIGFHLSYYRRFEKPVGPRLKWLVTAKLARANIADARWESIDSLTLRGLASPSEHKLSFDIASKPAIYRIEVVIRNGGNRKLARYGRYIRVLRPTFDARLTLARDSFYPGEGVVPLLENRGSIPLFFGLSYSIESFDGTSWTTAPISPKGPVLLIGIWARAGEATSCWGFGIPADAPPGLYRFALQAEAVLGGPRNNRQPFTATAEFRILPPA